MKSSSVIRDAVISMSVLVLLSACATMTPGETVEELLPVHTIAVLPTGVLLAREDQNTVTNQQREAGTAIIDTLLTDYFRGDARIRIISRSQQEGLNIDPTDTGLTAAIKTGRQLNCDAVLLTTVNRYLPRNGTNYSVTRPASVSFDYQLIAVDDGRILCSGVFDETQKSLSENIFAFSKATSRGFRWITAEELATEGLHQKLNNCSYLNHEGRSAQ